MNNSTKVNIVLGILVLMMGAALYLVYHKLQNKDQDFEAFKIALSNKLDTFTNKQGQQIATVQAAQFADRSSFKDAIKQLNAQGVNIQSKIDGNTQGLILLDKKIGGTFTGKTDVTKLDTVKNDTLKAKNGKDSIGTMVWPTYAFNDSNKFYHLYGNVSHFGYHITPLYYDSTELKPTLINGGLFKSSVLGVQSLNKNPYAKTTGLKYLTIKKTPAPIWKLISIIGILGGGIFIGTHIK